LEYSPLFYRGTLDVLFSLPRVAVVGTRKPSELGVARTRKLMREQKYTLG
jgi:predicted Rossmann fold nucleotide-binding protein DprA/Smf involved in DNA uptake